METPHYALYKSVEYEQLIYDHESTLSRKIFPGISLFKVGLRIDLYIPNLHPDLFLRTTQLEARPGASPKLVQLIGRVELFFTGMVTWGFP